MLTTIKAKAHVMELVRQSNGAIEATKKRLRREIKFYNSLMPVLEINPARDFLEKERDKAQRVVDRIKSADEYKLWQRENPNTVSELAATKKNVRTYYNRVMGLARSQRHLKAAQAIPLG